MSLNFRGHVPLFCLYHSLILCCRTFKWALSGGGKFPVEEGLNHPDLPEGTGEFLDAWLLLLEKMVNPKAILETSHMLPYRIPPCRIFEPIKYLQEVHKVSFMMAVAATLNVVKSNNQIEGDGFDLRERHPNLLLMVSKGCP